MAFNSYIINDEIIFNKDTFELKSVTDVNEAISLNAPTARCLLLLIERKGEVISRECFMDQVWHAHGIVVSENTFYQNISLLRKSLKKIAPKMDIVITVRSKGFFIADSTNIASLEDDSSAQSMLARNIIRENGTVSIFSASIEPTINGDRAKDSSSVLYQKKVVKRLILLLIVFILLELLSLVLMLLQR